MGGSNFPPSGGGGKGGYVPTFIQKKKINTTRLLQQGRSGCRVHAYCIQFSSCRSVANNFQTFSGAFRLAVLLLSP